MSQGTRGRWIRVAVAGLGVMVSTSLVGCTSWDKPKDTKTTAPPKGALPGTPSIPPGGAAQLNRQPGTAPFGGPGGNIQPTNFASNGPRPGANNLNTTTGAYPYGNSPTGGAGSNNAPIQPSVLPANWNGGPVGAAPIQPLGGATVNYGQTPPPASLAIIPPPPPAGNEFADGIVSPPNYTPIAPIAPTTPPPGAGPVYPSKNF